MTPSLCVAITGAGGSLGQALLRRWHARGARLIALSSGSQPLLVHDDHGAPIPLQQVRWQVGAEAELTDLLEQVDVLVLNHGVNVHGDRSAAAVTRSLEVNALSSWRLLEQFAAVVAARTAGSTLQPHRPRAEVWLNTSEAEIEPALSPLYELSKRLLGQLISLRALDLAGPGLRLRRLVLGPFRSSLNPIGVMSAGFVAAQVMAQARLGCNLIIVTPNPLTYLLMPMATLSRWLYFRMLSRPDQPLQPPQNEAGS
jgi:nucleoside-diphosphate-sugar epimerase